MLVFTSSSLLSSVHQEAVAYTLPAILGAFLRSGISVNGGGDRLGGATNLYRLLIGLLFPFLNSSDFIEFDRDLAVKDSDFSVLSSICIDENFKWFVLSDICSLFDL